MRLSDIGGLVEPVSAPITYGNGKASRTDVKWSTGTKREETFRGSSKAERSLNW
jgi:hypothetical protein